MKYNLAVTHGVSNDCLHGVYPYGEPKQLNNCMINNTYQNYEAKSCKSNNAFTAPCKGNFAKNV